MSILVFDIETVPDTASGRQLYSMSGLNDNAVANAMFFLRRQQSSQNAFIRHHLQKIVTISVLWQKNDQIEILSLGQSDSDEKHIINTFFKIIDKHTPTLVSWNGSGFDLPVLHYRALLNNITAPSYWEMGQERQEFKWNNYISRYHMRHLDVMDILAGYQPRASAPLDEIASMLGFPGKMGMSGNKVWEYYQDGKIDDIRNYCETDVLNTYLVYLRFELMRGVLNQASYDDLCDLLKHTLKNQAKPHLQEFLDNWQESL